MRSVGEKYRLTHTHRNINSHTRTHTEVGCCPLTSPPVPQVWTYCHLYRNVERFHTPEILNAAIKGGAFLLSHARVSPGSRKCAFVVRRGGAAVKVQRSMFSECFYVLAMDELWRVTGEERYKVRERD
uniref:Uncharacterized protein n=1 Tax=Callorhinchus milii TaxID=7868 RepID=A0A4W3GJE9_CALMI